MPQPCPCSTRHSPPINLAVTDLHHAPPSSYPMAAGAVRETVRLCANAHRLAHDALEDYRRAGGKPAASVLRRYPAIVRELAETTWARTDHTRPIPRTDVTGVVAAGEPSEQVEPA